MRVRWEDVQKLPLARRANGAADRSLGDGSQEGLKILRAFRRAGSAQCHAQAAPTR